MARKLMMCGCLSTGVDAKGRPVCASHVGIEPGAEVVNENPPNLDGRRAKCRYCENIRPSGFNLPYFRWNPEGEDEWYCGCRGWN